VIPSTIHESVNEESDDRYVRRSASPRTESNTVRPPVQKRSDSPSRTATLPSRNTSSLHDYGSTRPSPDNSASTLQPNSINKENRNPYYATDGGKLELTSIDSKTWVEQNQAGGEPRSQYSADSGAVLNHRSTDPTYPGGSGSFRSDDRQHGSSSTQTPYQSYQRHPGSAASTELPLITPTIGRSMSSADRRPDEPPLPHQLPPFVAYDAYQQAMTPMANGYPQAQIPQQAPPTVFQLPAGRKAFTVRLYLLLGINRSSPPPTGK
jgi:hypothetical protein